MSEEYVKTLKQLEGMTQREEALIKDSFRRFEFFRNLDSELAEVFGMVREISILEKESRFEEANSKRTFLRDYLLNLLNEFKVVYRNVAQLDKSAELTLSKIVEEEDKIVNHFMGLEAHNYKALRQILTQVTNSPAMKIEHRRVQKLINDIKEELAQNHELEKLDDFMETVLKKFRKIIKNQESLVKAIGRSIQNIISVIGDIKSNPTLSDSNIFRSEVSSLKGLLSDMHESLTAEQGDVFVVLNKFLAKKKDALRLLEYTVAQTHNKDLLTARDVRQMLAVVTSLDEAFELLLQLFEVKELFDRNAQGVIQSEMTYYSKLLRENTKSARYAFIDNLTRLPNRYAYQAKIRDLDALKGRRFAMIALDIDFFKGVNEVFGHDGGDVILKEFADVISHGLRRTDTLFRIGGEEFAILLLDTDLRGAKAVANKFRKILNAHHFTDLKVVNETHRAEYWADGRLRVREGGRMVDVCKRKFAPSQKVLSPFISASFGVASYIPGRGVRANQVLSLADKAATIAKSNGRNCVEVAKRAA